MFVMKFWSVLLAILTILIGVTSLQAQAPYCVYPFNPTFCGYPFNPSYAYPPAFSNQLISYYLPNYVPPDPAVMLNIDGIVNDLTNQVQRLTEEVQRLQNELITVRAQPPQVSVVEAPPPRPETPAPPVALIFNNGRRVETRAYAIMGQTLLFATPQGYMR